MRSPCRTHVFGVAEYSVKRIRLTVLGRGSRSVPRAKIRDDSPSQVASMSAARRTAISSQIFERPRRLLRQVLDRAAERGEIPPGRQLGLVPDLLIGLNMLSVVLGRTPDREFVRRVFAEIIYPLVTAPSGLTPLNESRVARGDLRNR